MIVQVEIFLNWRVLSVCERHKNRKVTLQCLGRDRGISTFQDSLKKPLCPHDCLVVVEMNIHVVATQNIFLDAVPPLVINYSKNLSLARVSLHFTSGITQLAQLLWVDVN